MKWIAKMLMMTMFVVCSPVFAYVNNEKMQGNEKTLCQDLSRKEMVSFPSFLCHLSDQLNTTGKIDKKRLRLFRKYVDALVPAARNSMGKQLKIWEINSQTVFAESIVQQEMAKRGIEEISHQKLVCLYRTARYLKIEPLALGFAYYIAKRIHEGVHDTLLRSKFLGTKRLTLESFSTEEQCDIQRYLKAFASGNKIKDRIPSKITVWRLPLPPPKE